MTGLVLTCVSLAWMRHINQKARTREGMEASDS